MNENKDKPKKIKLNEDIIFTHDKYETMEIEPIEINDKTIEQKKRALAEFYGMIKRSVENDK